MKVKALVLAAAASPLILSGASEAAFTGLSVDTTPATGQPGNLTRVRVYANFDNANDFLVAVAGAPLPGAPLNYFTTAAGGFFQESVVIGEQNFAQNNGVTGAFNGFRWDTFLTIGYEAGWNATLPADQTSATGLDFSGWTGGGGQLLSDPNTGGAYFLLDAGATSQQFPDANGQVIIAQLTADIGLGGGGVIGGEIPILQYNGNEEANNLSFSVPSPGALALLGLAGLASRRRRR